MSFGSQLVIKPPPSPQWWKLAHDFFNDDWVIIHLLKWIKQEAGSNGPRTGIRLWQLMGAAWSQYVFMLLGNSTARNSNFLLLCNDQIFLQRCRKWNVLLFWHITFFYYIILRIKQCCTVKPTVQNDEAWSSVLFFHYYLEDPCFLVPVPKGTNAAYNFVVQLFLFHCKVLNMYLKPGISCYVWLHIYIHFLYTVMFVCLFNMSITVLWSTLCFQHFQCYKT